MPPTAPLKMQLLSAFNLDPRTFQMSVFENERERTYTMNVGVGRWIDGDKFVLKPDPRHFRLMELWSAWLDERKLDAYVGLDGVCKILHKMPPAQAPSYGPLPPVPASLPKRAPLPRR